MFPTVDPKLFEQLTVDPASFLNKLADFQRANFEAAREIAETNNRAFQELASLRDPRAFLSVQSAILQAAAQQNMEILTRLWQSAASEAQPPAPSSAPAKPTNK